MLKFSKNTQKNSKREVGLQSIIQPKLYESPHILCSKNLETVEYSRLFYHSHTLIFLFLGFVCLQIFIYVSKDWNALDAQWLALKLGVLMVLLFSAFYMPDTILTRPHPFLWRVALGANLLYAFFLVYLNIVPLDLARSTMRIFDAKLGVPLAERSYAEDCRLFTPENPDKAMKNLSDAIDCHVAAHLFGWVFKALIMRDIKVCWICSVVFELAEITFMHWLPNFAECWWDHLVLDVFGCNMVGIMLGALILRYWSVKKLDWIYVKHAEERKYLYTEWSALRRAFQKFKPNIFMKHDWEIFQSLKRFYGVIIYCVLVNWVDLDNFFMKTILQVPPNHYILVCRLVLWLPLAIAGSEEYFEYITNKYSKRVRPHMWVLLLVLSLEISFVVKHWDVFMGNPFPTNVKVMWASIAFILGVVTVWVYVKNKDKEEEASWNPYDPPMDFKSVAN